MFYLYLRRRMVWMDRKAEMEMSLIVKIIILVVLLIAAMILWGILSGQAGEILSDLLGVM
tara:strand:- start:36 stop:215 length:180 start_codon:yes stop_codon:yes gene_type:complete